MVDVSTRKLTLKVDIEKFNHDIGDYPGYHQTARISLKYKNNECITGVLPTDIPISQPYRVTMRLNTQRVLGECWDELEDVSCGADKMVMKLKLPRNSPIAVHKVQVIDESNPSRCWKSYWRDQDYNKQNNQWVTGKALHEAKYPHIPDAANNFDQYCIH